MIAQSFSPHNMTQEIVIASAPENIHLVEGFVEGLREKLGFKDDVFGNVMVAITEAVNNSILHGNEGDSSKKVTITCTTLNPYRLQINVADEGKGFDPSGLKDPTAPENLSNPGGRGVFLMMHLCDQVNFEDKGRRVEMIFNI